MKVYLAGPIHACSDKEAQDWRDYATSILGQWLIDVLDPMDRDYRGREADSFVDIITQDKRDVLDADVLLAYVQKPSVGTSMEVLYAWEHGKRVLVVAPDAVSPWLRYHSEAVFSTLDDALDYLR